jgi:outer membrane receptor protein involved in Fe transport
VEGKIISAENNEPVFGVIVHIDSVPKAKTSLDGVYKLSMNEGKHVLTFSNESDNYTTQSMDIMVKNGSFEVLDVVLTKSNVRQMSGVTVVGAKLSAGTTSYYATDKKRMEENSTTDGLPKEQIVNTGVPSAAEAVQMIPGASVQDGKDVYIRGLGDRYSQTILNGMSIPSLNPQKNSVQLDIFPAILIDNITVYKTFTPNLVGDFAGGLIDISTRDFPAKKMIYAKISLGYNTNATFNPNFISYKGGKLDFLGFDDGTRKLKINPTVKIPNPASNNSLTTQMTSSFSDVMATQKSTSFLNQNYTFSIGDQKVINKKNKPRITYGYNFALNYSATNNFYKDAQYNEYRKSPTLSQNELYLDRGSKGELAEKEVMWTALLGQSFRLKSNKISFTIFHTQNSISSAASLTQVNTTSNPSVIKNQSLQYTQRAITNLNLNGLHYIGENRKWKFEWKISPTYSTISDPDIRSTLLEEVTNPNGSLSYELNGGAGAEIRRMYRLLKEFNIASRADMSYQFKQWKKLPSTLSFGLYTIYKNRSYDVTSYVFDVKGPADETGDPNWFFKPDNLWNTQSNQGVYGIGQKEKANIYKATQNISAFYLMNELPFNKNFSATYGARIEKNGNFYTGQSNNAEYDPNALKYTNQRVLNELNVLPSVNFVYKLRKNQDSSYAYARNTNFRLSYSNTLARPSFREISISQIYDPIQGRRYLGNIDLKQTFIYNADFRFEHFFGKTELISASLFYKKFINPIEVVANVAAPNEFKPVNAGEADLYGAEVEIRKEVGFRNNEKMDLSIGANFTYNFSRVNMNKIHTTVGDQVYTEKEIREANARVGEKIGDYRTMYGQSPYVANAFLTFKHNPSHLMININYNVQGKRLAVIGVGALPDVYELPFHSLNVKISKSFGKIRTDLYETTPRWTASIQGQNLLNKGKRRYYQSYGAKDQVFDFLKKGLTISFSVVYSIR